MRITTPLIGLLVLLACVQASCAPRAAATLPATASANAEQELLALSRQKWRWMADKDVARLEPLFHDRSKFLHMSGTWGKRQELEIIRTGSIWYRQADVHDAAVEVFENTALVWSRITLHAVVRGSEVSTQFTVTETFQRQGSDWKLLALSFSSVRDTHTIQK
jgi:hypothetical protein